MFRRIVVTFATGFAVALIGHVVTREMLVNASLGLTEQNKNGIIVSR